MLIMCKRTNDLKAVVKKIECLVGCNNKRRCYNVDNNDSKYIFIYIYIYKDKFITESF